MVSFSRRDDDGSFGVCVFTNLQRRCARDHSACARSGFFVCVWMWRERERVRLVEERKCAGARVRANDTRSELLFICPHSWTSRNHFPACVLLAAAAAASLLSHDDEDEREHHWFPFSNTTLFSQSLTANFLVSLSMLFFFSGAKAVYDVRARVRVCSLQFEPFSLSFPARVKTGSGHAQAHTADGYGARSEMRNANTSEDRRDFECARQCAQKVRPE